MSKTWINKFNRKPIKIQLLTASSSLLSSSSLDSSTSFGGGGAFFFGVAFLAACSQIHEIKSL
jgi:hypothetical protein